MADTTWDPRDEEPRHDAPPQDHLPFMPPDDEWSDWEIVADRTIGFDTEPVEPPAARPRVGLGRMLAVSLLSGVLGAALAVGAVLWLDRDGGSDEATNVTVVERLETQILTPEESGTTAAAVATRVLPSIVTVEVRQTAGGTPIADSSGSGVVISADGLLVTNHHVVEGAAEVRAVFADGRTYVAEIVGSDELSDIALIKIDAAGLTPVELGSAESLQIGEPAIAIGSPLGLEGGPSVTVGVVSAFDRRVQTSVTRELYGMLQTDAPITRGSSGGALVDDEGRLIGITTAIGVSDVGAEGLGFAVPIEMVMRIVDDLDEFGEARHPFMGIRGTTFFDEEPDGAVIPSGVVISEIVPGGAAEGAGIQPGDIILQLDGEDVTTMERLVVDIRFYRVGDSIDVLIEREGEQQMIPVALLERPEDV